MEAIQVNKIKKSAPNLKNCILRRVSRASQISRAGRINSARNNTTKQEQDNNRN